MAIIRPGVQGDASTLLRLARSAYERYVDRIGREPAPMTEDYLSLSSAGEVWVAEHDGVLAGLLVLKLKSDHVLLDNVAVAPDFQAPDWGRNSWISPIATPVS